MAGSEVVAYAADLRAQLASLGVGAPELDELLAAAQDLKNALYAADGVLDRTRETAPCPPSRPGVSSGAGWGSW